MSKMNRFRMCIAAMGFAVLIVGSSWVAAQSGAVPRNTSPPLQPVDDTLANPPELTVQRPGANPILDGIPEAITSLIEKGEFTAAIEKLEALPAAEVKSLGLTARDVQWQVEKLRRYKIDYGMTRNEVVNAIKKRLDDFNPSELNEWIQEGLVDRMNIDGEERFCDPTVSNLFFLSSALRDRKEDNSESNLQKYVYAKITELKQLRSKQESPLVQPMKYNVKMVLTAKDAEGREGQILRCWMPFPREYPFIQDLKLLESVPESVQVAPPDADQRTVHFEQKITKDDASTSFGVVYEFTAWSRVNQIEDEKVKPVDPKSPEAMKWTGEAPHVRFTPEMQDLYKKIAGDEANPARLARAFYVWISNNIRYSYAREYSTLDDIGLYCAARRAGDCGQEALLFITLCRMAGIPARWQSGWTAYPDWKGLHDWAEIYLDPYGWVPVDPYMGIWATRYMDTLTPKQRHEVRDFYFGSMDAHRLPANANHSAAFIPPKKGFRSDDVDNQRGEMEWEDGTNLYFGEYRRSMTITALDGN